MAETFSTRSETRPRPIRAAAPTSSLSAPPSMASLSLSSAASTATPRCRPPALPLQMLWGEPGLRSGPSELDNGQRCSSSVGVPEDCQDAASAHAHRVLEQVKAARALQIGPCVTVHLLLVGDWASGMDIPPHRLRVVSRRPLPTIRRKSLLPSHQSTTPSVEWTTRRAPARTARIGGPSPSAMSRTRSPARARP